MKDEFKGEKLEESTLDMDDSAAKASRPPRSESAGSMSTGTHDLLIN